MLEDYFYLIDIALVIVIIVVVGGAYLSGRLSRFMLYLFIAGFFIGMTWELSLHFLGPHHSDDPLFINLQEWPLHPLLQPILHCVWDGALFMTGALLVRRFTPPPHFDHFDWREVAVLSAWGFVSALTVEIVGTFGGWVYVEQPWNPILFTINDGHITLLPLLIWMIAPVVFYAVALRIAAGMRQRESVVTNT